MRNLILISIFCLTGCLGNTTLNTALPNWQYMRSDAPGYAKRDKATVGNCVAYSLKVRAALVLEGYDDSRLELWCCKVGGEKHMACVVDGHLVYTVGAKWVLEKDDLDWEWYEVSRH